MQGKHGNYGILYWIPLTSRRELKIADCLTMSIIGGLSRRPSCRTGLEELAVRRPGSQMQNNRGRADVHGGTDARISKSMRGEQRGAFQLKARHQNRDFAGQSEQGRSEVGNECTSSRKKSGRILRCKDRGDFIEVSRCLGMWFRRIS